MKLLRIFGPALAAAAIAAGCSSGNGGVTPSSTVATAARANAIVSDHRHRRKVRATFVIAFHHRRRGRMHPGSLKPQYISPNTASFGATVAVGEGAPGSPQFVNTAGCPTVNGVTTCNLTVGADPGVDTFTVSAYSAQNGGGSLLASGSIVATITEGTANVTEPVVLDGVVHTILLSLPVAKLPLGQSQNLVISAKDASGATIIGTYDHAISLSAGHLAFSPSNVPDSTTGKDVKVSWSYGYEPSSATSDTITASSGAHQAQLSLTPSAGFAYYQVGNDPTYDQGGFGIVTGPDGKLYYANLGSVVCVNNLCSASNNAIGQFDPATHAFSEIDISNSGVLTPYFTSDGALWMGGGFSHNLYRIPSPSTSFTSADLQTIAVPSPASGGYNIRTLAQDGSGKLWFTDMQGGRVLTIPVASPAANLITPYPLPTGAAGSVGKSGRGRSIAYGSDGNIYVGDFFNGQLDQFATTGGSTGTATNEYVFPEATAIIPEDYCCLGLGFSAAANGKIYTDFTGPSLFGVADGGLDSFTISGSTFAALPLAPGPYQTPWWMAINSNGTILAFSDLGASGLGLADLSGGTVTSIPMSANGQLNSPLIPNGTAFANDGTVWFTCYGASLSYQPSCLGHPDYLSGWSLWPSQTLQIYGTGSGAAQVVGIMESPAASTAPFSVQSDDTSTCTVTQPTTNNPFNFEITGVSAGTCNVTVTDKNSVSETIAVGVTTTSGVINLRQRHARIRRMEQL